MINLCPKCNKPPDTFDGRYFYCECGNCWEREPEPIIRAFPYPLHTVLYSPNIFDGKVQSVDKYEIMGYRFDERGTWARLRPLSYDGIETDWRLPTDKLYPTKEDCERSIKNA